MDGFSKLCGHMTNLFYALPETRGGTTSPLAQITPLSPNKNQMQKDMSFKDMNN